MHHRRSNMEDMCSMLVTILFILLVVLVLLMIAKCMKHSYYHHHEKTGAGVFRLKVSDPEYTNMLKGEKTVEARLDRAPFHKLKEGEDSLIVRSRPQGDTSEYPGGEYKFNAEIVKIKKYPNIDALIKGEGVSKVYPSRTAAAGKARFEEYLPEGTTASDAVLAIEIKKSKKKGAGAGYMMDNDSENDDTEEY